MCEGRSCLRKAIDCACTDVGQREMTPTQHAFWRVGQALVSFFLAGLVSGCAMVGPDYKQPPVKLNQNWLEIENPRAQSGYRDYRTWWQAFNDPTLDRLI